MLILPLQGATFFTVKIAVYNKPKLLQYELNKLSPYLKKTIQIRQRGKSYIATSFPTQDKKILQKLLPSYRKVFSDAFISIYKPPKGSLAIIEKNIFNLKEKKTKISSPIKKRNIPLDKSSFYDKIKQKTLYLCTDGKAAERGKLFIRVTFLRETVIYTPISGNLSAFNIKYKIKNNKLYLFQKGQFNAKIYNKLEATTSDYYLISSWVEKKKINTIRYYFNPTVAKAYMASLK